MRALAPYLRQGRVQLAVLDDLAPAVPQGEHADGLLGVRLGHDLGSGVGLARRAEAQKDGVADAHEAVVHAVKVDVLDAAAVEVVQGACHGPAAQAERRRVRPRRPRKLGAGWRLASATDAPDRLSAAKTPPLPSGFLAMAVGEASRIWPVSDTLAISPCLKKKTSASGSPKCAWSRK